MRIALTLGFTLVLAQGAWAQGIQQDNGVALPAASAVPAIEPVQPGNPTLPVVTPPASASVKPQALSPADVALYRQIFAAERGGQTSKAKKLLAKVSDPVLKDHADAVGLLSAKRVTIGELVDWLGQHRDLSIADQVYRTRPRKSASTIKRQSWRS